MRVRSMHRDCVLVSARYKQKGCANLLRARPEHQDGRAEIVRRRLPHWRPPLFKMSPCERWRNVLHVHRLEPETSVQTEVRPKFSAPGYGDPALLSITALRNRSSIPTFWLGAIIQRTEVVAAMARIYNRISSEACANSPEFQSARPWMQSALASATPSLSWCKIAALLSVYVSAY